MKKGISSITDLGITLANNEMKDIIKVIKSLENRGILLKVNTKKVTAQEEGLLNFLNPLMLADLSLIKNVLTVLSKISLISLKLTAAALATYAVIQKNIFGSDTTALIISNEEMKTAMKIVKSVEHSVLLMKVIREAIKNEVKKQKDRFIRMLLGSAYTR